MVKRFNGLWPEVVEFENLFTAFQKAEKGKRYNGEVLRFSRNLEENLFTLQNELICKYWKPSKYREFCVKEPKLRLIQAPAFRDRIVHHALYNVLRPIFEKSFIKDSYACIEGKGTHRAVQRVQSFLSMHDKKTYVLKADIAKYFPSINHKVLFDLISRKIKDPNVLWLCQKIIISKHTNIGLPIGSLTSQLFANIYLDRLDHYIKDYKGVKSYVRYMDDFIITSESKEFLKKLLLDIEFFIKKELLLSLNPKTSIYPAKQGIDFAGYRIWKTYILPRKRVIKRARKNFKSMQKKYNRGEIDLEYIKPRLTSFLGYTKHCSSKVTVSNILRDFTLQRKIN